MAVRNILELGNSLLWEKSAIVLNPTDGENRSLIQDLSDTLAAYREGHGFGRGIAAPQIGILSRVIYIRMASNEFTGALFNPEIKWADDQTIELWDGCFSFPDLLVRIPRALKICVKYIDEEGASKTRVAEGDLSELLQHELDHLDGVLAVSQAVSPRSFMTRAEWVRAGSPR